MTALIVVVLCVLFLGIELAVRAVSARMTAARVRREREAVLRTSVQATFADEAKSLKRVEVPSPKARILAVDDESIVLDSFRKILVLAGFSVDTVESGPEALTLVRARDYDFLFTDLMMPTMNGVEVVKAVKHLRPDLDVAVITGFGTIETAVETMTHGAIDYVQKPFTEDELVAFAHRLVIKRHARLEAQGRPTVRVVPSELAELIASREFCVPGGTFVSPGHAWARIEDGGDVSVGMDDFARKALQRVDRIEVPAAGTVVQRGDVLFVVRRRDDSVRFRAPVAGTVTVANPELKREPRLALDSPYERGWVCQVRPSDLTHDLGTLRIGKTIVSWYQDEVMKLRRESAGTPDGAMRWPDLETTFLAAGEAPREDTTQVVGAG